MTTILPEHTQADQNMAETCREIITHIIHGSGKFKEVACNIWPHVPLENAKTYLSKALAPNEQKFDIDWIPIVCRVTGWDDFLFWLCYRLGYEKPVKKPKISLESELQELRELKKNIEIILKGKKGINI